MGGRLKKAIAFIGAILFLIAIIFIMYNSKVIASGNLFKRSSGFSMLSSVFVDLEGNKYVVDESNTNIIAISPDNEFIYSVNGGGGENTFNTTSSICVDDDGNLYVADVYLSEKSRYQQNERILKFNNKGKFQAIIQSRDFSGEKRMINSSLLNMIYYDGKLYYAGKTKDKVEIYSIQVKEKQGGEKTEKTYDFENADIMLAQFAINPKNLDIYATSKDANIYKFSGGGYERIYTGGNEDKESGYFEIPFGISYNYNSDRLYYSDIGTREIYRLDLDTYEKSIVYKRNHSQRLDYQDIAYRIFALSQSEDQVAFTFKYSCHIYDGDNSILNCEGYSFPAGVKIFHYALMASGAILVIAVAWLSLKLVAYCIRAEDQTFQTRVFMFVGIVILFITITSIILATANQKYYERTVSSLSGFSQLVADSIDGDVLEKIDTPDDYMNEDYQHVRNELHSALDESYDWCGDTYAVIYRKYNGIVTYLVYLSDDYGGFYPDSFPYEDSDYRYNVETGRQSVEGDYLSPEGSWMYTTTPIYNSKGEIVGIVEVGEDLISYKQETRSFIRELLIRIVPLTLIVFTLISELVYFFNDVLKKLNFSKDSDASIDSNMPVSIVRTIVFVVYMADNFTSVLIPILSMRIFNPALGIPEEIAIALPAGAYALALALSSFGCGQIVGKTGIKKMLIFGTLLHASGLLLCGIYLSSTLVFTFEMIMVGVGMGMNLVAINSIIVARADTEEQNIGFSLLTAGIFAGTNAGIILGTNFAAVMSYGTVFIISAGISAVTLTFAFALIKQSSVRLELLEAEKDERLPFFRVIKFLFRPRVIIFVFLCALPYMVFGSFIFYFIPIYASEQGWSEALIGLLSLSYGICASYLSPMLTRFVLNVFGSRITILISSVLTLSGIILFVINPAASVMIIVTVLMGVADSVGYPALSSYYVELSENENMDAEKAMGVYNLFDGTAQTIGPFIFSAALAIGMKKGVMTIGMGFAILVSLFVISLLKRRRKA